MVAKIKANVLIREERAIGSISMQRLLGSGMVGGGMYMLLPMILPLPNWSSYIFLIVGTVGFLIATGNREGIPRWKFVAISVRGRIMVAARDQGGGSLQSKICDFFDWDFESTVVDAADIFEGVEYIEDETWMELRFRGSVFEETSGIGVHKNIEDILDISKYRTRYIGNAEDESA